MPLCVICASPSVDASAIACWMNIELSGITNAPLTELEAFAASTRLSPPFAPEVIVVISA